MKISWLAIGALCISSQVYAQDSASSGISDLGSGISDLGDELALVYDSFTLNNGLTVVVHEDRKAPLVAVAVWYNVGAKDEPAGRTGFAHLYEHLMFKGSENLPGEYFGHADAIGALDTNGTTSFDYTRYFQTVPTGALERALFMESDRMGYFLGAMSPELVDTQIGVVQNEKRSFDNRPGGLVDYEVHRGLFPEGHPYRHRINGSMEDLDAATLEDVTQWFRERYGPNNAVLVLAGDIDIGQARPLVERYFGAIPPGPNIVGPDIAIPVRAQESRVTINDRVPRPRVELHWAVDRMSGADREALHVAQKILGGLQSSRFDTEIVAGETIAENAWAGYTPLEKVGMFEIGAQAKDIDQFKLVEKRLREILARFIAEGPTSEEVDRAVADILADTVDSLEQVGGFQGKATALAQGVIYAGSPDFHNRSIEDYLSMTPERVRAAAARWLSPPPLVIELLPGERPPYEEASLDRQKLVDTGLQPTSAATRALPEVGETRGFTFPDIETVTLTSGAKLHYVRRDTLPLTKIRIDFDAGSSSDPIEARGTSSLAMSYFEEKDKASISKITEGLGARLEFVNEIDTSAVKLSVISSNLSQTLDLVREVLDLDAFDTATVSNVREKALSLIEHANTDPEQIMQSQITKLLYAPDHPYASSAFGNATYLKVAQASDLMDFHSRYIRPDNMELYVVSNLPRDRVVEAVERAFGSWLPPKVAKGEKDFPSTSAFPESQEIVLIDVPDTPQSVIGMAQLIAVEPKNDLTELIAANEALGGSFTARLNMKLREEEGWSYGTFGWIDQRDRDALYLITAPVQADQTANSILALRSQIASFLGANGVTEEELERIVSANVSSLPGKFEQSEAVLDAVRDLVRTNKDTNYYRGLQRRYREYRRDTLDRTIRSALQTDRFITLVVGDLSIVAPQLDEIGLAYRIIELK